MYGKLIHEPGMYRVFGCSGGAGSDVILSALMKAASDGADVISMSLGLVNPYEFQDPFYTVTEALVSSNSFMPLNGKDLSYTKTFRVFKALQSLQRLVTTERTVSIHPQRQEPDLVSSLWDLSITRSSLLPTNSQTPTDDRFDIRLFFHSIAQLMG